MNQKIKTLFRVIRLKDIQTQNNFLTDYDDSIQVSARKLSKDFVVKAHKHLPIERHTNNTQEAWVVIKGMIQAIVYNTNDEITDTINLYAGDCIVFFCGGHELRVGEEGSIIYELKTGPYYDNKLDKEFI